MARIAYSDLLETQRQQYMLEDFTQSINNPSFVHQLQARGVTSLEAALREGEAYLQAQRLYENPRPETHPPGGVPTTPLEASLHTATDRLITIMTRAMTTIARARAIFPAIPPEVSKRKLPPDSRKPRRPPRPGKPGKESKNNVPRRTSVRTPQYTPNGWQTLCKTGHPERPREAFILSLANRFSQLLDPELAGEVYPDIGGQLPTPPLEGPHLQRPRKPPKKRAPPRVAKTEHAEEVRVQPHGDSIFLPGKITGRDVTFLLDSGCTTNLLSRRVFNTLPPKERGELAPYTGEPGTLADGSSIPFNGVIELTGRVHDQTAQEIFVINPVEEDAILGMPFLKWHGCRIDFSGSALLMAGRELTCVDKSGRPLAGSVQAVRKCTIPGRSRATVHCRVNNSRISGLGVVEGAHTSVRLASSLNRLTDRGEILVQCVNPFSEAVTIPSGTTLGRFCSIQEKDIGPSLGEMTEGPQQSPSSRRRTVPAHDQELYQTTCNGCASDQER